MKFEKFEDIIAWQKAGALTMEIYRIFINCNDFGFLNQIRRAVVSIMNNIAEGYERNTNKEFKNFLFIAKGSSAEVRSMLYIALRLKYITNGEFRKLYCLTMEVSKLLLGLIKTL
jgi:four helix bundle protein